jgi:hypothetical protein
MIRRGMMSQVPEAHTCNPTYLWGWDWEDHSLRTARAISSRNPHFQNNHSNGLEAWLKQQSLASVKPWVQTPVPQKKKESWWVSRLENVLLWSQPIFKRDRWGGVVVGSSWGLANVQGLRGREEANQACLINKHFVLIDLWGQEVKHGPVWWYTSVIPATWEA